MSILNIGPACIGHVIQQTGTGLITLYNSQQVNCTNKFAMFIFIVIVLFIVKVHSDLLL